MSILAFILFLVVAGICALIADAIVPGRIPGGFLVATIFGVIGAWLGTALLGNLGPSLAGVSLIPTILGAALLVFVVSLFSGYVVRR